MTANKNSWILHYVADSTTLVKKNVSFTSKNAFYEIFSSSLAYAGFYASVVRAMLLCCEFAKKENRLSWLKLLEESVGFTVVSNVFMPASFIIYPDWRKWRALDQKVNLSWSYFLLLPLHAHLSVIQANAHILYICIRQRNSQHHFGLKSCVVDLYKRTGSICRCPRVQRWMFQNNFIHTCDTNFEAHEKANFTGQCSTANFVWN